MSAVDIFCYLLASETQDILSLSVLFDAIPNQTKTRHSGKRSIWRGRENKETTLVPLQAAGRDKFPSRNV